MLSSKCSILGRDPVKTAVGDARRDRRLGPEPACALCGWREPAALRRVTDPALIEAVRQILLERHHVLGREHDSRLTIFLCLNHHALVSDSQRRGAASMSPEENFLFRLRAALRSLAAFLEQALAAVERWLTDLEDFISFLDTESPTWRDLWRKRK